MTVKHTLANGAEIEITGYYYLSDTVYARANINGKWYDGELLPPERQSEKARKVLEAKGCAGYWAFDIVAVPAAKGEEIRAMAETARNDKIAADKATFEAAKAEGKAFRTAEITEQYGAELVWARRFAENEKSEYAEWFKNLGMRSFAGSPRIEVEKEAVRQVVGSRKSDGQFCGCTNNAWTITEEEWDKIVKLSEDIKDKKAQARKEFEAAEAADIQRKVDTGYCFACESWCHGDCGHYSNDPMVKFRRDLDEAQKEANYGINEG